MSCCATTQSTLCMCGTFETPDTPDQGQCASYRVKRDCEAPLVPVLSTIDYDPDASPPFTVG